MGVTETNLTSKQRRQVFKWCHETQDTHTVRLDVGSLNVVDIFSKPQRKHKNKSLHANRLNISSMASLETY
uniref:Uncharacterized protein n=1 Tax=Rhizophora mucronata TaxID=61149 RepID=A0A2P2P817_RHIMU